MTNNKSRAALVSMISNSLLILLKVAAGLLTGSISLLAEGIHSGMDLMAAIVAFVSVRVSDKPADREHPFGHGKAENISGAVEALLIFVAAIIIVYEAVQRIITGSRLELLEIGIGIMAVSILVNILVSRYLMRISRQTDSLALEADAKHLTTDVLTMTGVLLGLTIARLTGLNVLDPITAILVALLILKTAYDLMRKSSAGLIDTRLPQEEEDIIKSCLSEHKGQLVSFHEVRTRKAGSWRYIDLHMVMPNGASVQEAHRMCDHLEQDIKNRLSNVNITIHVEPCNMECEVCRVSCQYKSDKS